MGKGVSACATCDGFFYKGQDVVVVGGGNTAVEEALYLSNIASKVTVVHRRDKFRAEAILIDKLMAKTEERRQHPRAVEPHAGRSSGRRIRRDRRAACQHVKTGATQRLSVHGVFIAIGHTPNTQIFEGQLDDGRRLHQGERRRRGQRDRDQRARRVRRGRRRRSRLSPGRHQRRHRLHGGAGRRGVSGNQRPEEALRRGAHGGHAYAPSAGLHAGAPRRKRKSGAADSAKSKGCGVATRRTTSTSAQAFAGRASCRPARA